MKLLQQLSFNKKMEQQFQDYYFKKSSFIMKFSLVLAIALYCIYGITDLIMLPLTKETAWIIRFGIIIPFLIATFIVSFTKLFIRYNQILMTSLAFLLGIGIIVMLICSHDIEVGHNYYFTGIMLVIMWIYTFSRIRFFKATGTALIISSMYLVMEAIINRRFSTNLMAPDTAFLINNTVFFLSANIIGIFASFSSESYIRSDFLNRSEITHKESIIHKNQQQLKDMMLRVHESSIQLEELSTNMFSAAEKLTDGANSQAAGIEQISASIKKISQTIERNLENTEDTGKLAQLNRDKSREGGDAVIQTMNALKRIDDHIQLINDIAFQTNILALNAAIEAARAGTAGRGFSIVANEVKKLAATSHDTAARITELVTSGVAVGEQTGKLFEEILPGIEETAELVQKISYATRDQSSSLHEIQEGMKNLNDIAQNTSSLADSIQKTSDRLKVNAAQMTSLVDSIENREILKLTASDAQEVSEQDSFIQPE